MLSLVPAVVGMPGGVELLVIAFILFLLFGVPVALAVLVGYRYLQGRTSDDRIDDLEAEIESLRETVEDVTETGEDDADAPGVRNE